MEPEIAKKLESVKKLEEKYIEECMMSPNSDNAIRTFLNWIGASTELFLIFYSEDNDSYKNFISQDIIGSGYELNKIYRKISLQYHQMISEIENGISRAHKKRNCPSSSSSSCDSHPLVFISHASSDKKIIDEFIDLILKNGIGLSDDNIVCTSFEKTTMAPGDNIPNYIREKISYATVVLAMVSKEYKKSEVCMNEVGAAWAFENEPISIVLPDADFTELGWLFNLDKAVKINNPDALNHLQEILCERLGMSIKTSLHWNPCVNKFLGNIKNIILV